MRLDLLAARFSASRVIPVFSFQSNPFCSLDAGSLKNAPITANIRIKDAVALSSTLY